MTRPDTRISSFPIEQFVFVAFEDMDNDADGIQG